MVSPEVPFPELLQLARAGDRDALDRLVRTYEADVRIAARVLLGPALRPHLDTVDLVQSVHRSLMLGVRQDKFNVASPAQLIALALTIVRRKVARKWRHHRRQLPTAASANSDDVLSDVLTSLHSTETDPARAAQLREAAERVVRGLDADDRRLLELRLEGWSTAEVARLLGQNPDILRVRLHRLRKQLLDTGVLSEWL
ncbi:MAG: sigma-70 family RNA polymerase sigma factor [Planctomycetia bacterium]|nr:sigma-70 family RNA polymerase sigma factor [Planctomycetia bacterium]